MRIKKKKAPPVLRWRIDNYRHIILLKKDQDPRMIYEKIAQLVALIPMQVRKKRRTKGQKKSEYRDCICAFDIETTNYKEIEESFMYIWQFCIWRDGHYIVILGRTWKQFTLLLQYLNRDLGKDQRIVCYIHNADFEFQFLTGIYPFKEDDVFCLDKRRIGKFTMMDKIEFRCSHKLTNLSLHTFTKQMGVKHRKLEGEKFDYSILRTPGRALKRYELQYCINDVVGLCEAISEKLRREDDDLYSVVLTSTGYVRREARKNWGTLNYHWRYDIQPDLELFDALQEAFRGGNTHASRLFAFDVLDAILSFDRSSSYPEVLVNHLYPGGKMWHIGPISTSEMRYKLDVNHLALLMKVRIYDIKLKDSYCAMPYIPVSKVIAGHEVFEDNGRILSIGKGEYIEMTITDVDLRIISRQYQWSDFEILDSWGSKYKKLPDPLIALVLKYYKLKTELKGVKGSEALYLAAKEKLNSIYGMMVQNPMRPSILYKRDDPEDPYREKYENREEKLASYNKKAFLPMQFGVWCTAWARYELEVGIKIVEDQGGYPVYCDTDSVKFQEGEQTISFDEYNDKKIAMAIESGAWADDPSGERHYMGVFEFDGFSEKFITCGAKKYVSADKEGHCKITVSGVPKKKGARELERKGGIEAFGEGFLFEDAGLAVKYNDHSDRWIKIGDEDIHITSNTYLYTDTYVVGVTDKYKDAVRIAKQLLTEDDPFAILGI